MFDALLYCHVMADIRHGYFLIVADFVRTITAEFRALWAKTLRAKTSQGDGAGWPKNDSAENLGATEGARAGR